ncbi:dystroglycan [Onchocerca flexuosa]|uniref:Dystroglycan 1 n=3 Tax=Onchocerca flexuosa TaxID=387005 RepID=A0A238BWN7_9BILA|nr:dystroglycan [Onchocerca flexuosa]
MEYLRPIILPLLICITNTIALIPEIVELVIGQPFHYAFQINSNVLDVQDASGEELPTWLIWKKDERILEGVSQPTDAGKTFLRITNDQINDVMEISVKEEITNPCGAERTTLWMEIAFDTSLSNLSIVDQLHLVNVVSKFFNISSSSLRVYSNKYKEEIRRAEVVESGMQHKPNNDSVTIMWKVSCEEIDENAIDVLEKMLTFDESDALAISRQKLFGWELRKGTLLPRKQRNHFAGTDVMSQFSGFITNEPYVNFEVTTSKTTTRFTRSTKKDDRPPVRLHSLQAFTCRRGMMCEYPIPRKTFIDAEDGDTRSLSLSVCPIVADNNWLTLDRKNKQILHGISLNTGDFEFRLEARDSANQMTSAPFRVTVIPEPPTNHLFILDVDHSSERLAKDPDTLCAFAEKLANSLGDRFPKNLVIKKIEAIDSVRRQARVIFSNASLSHKFCQKKAIEAIKHVMLTRRRDRIRAEFVRAMDSRFHVRNVKLEFQGSCIEQLPTSRLPANVSLSTTINPTDHDTSSVHLWLPVALIAFLKFFLATLALVCCLVKRKRAKAVQSEYISKGLPVVFPEEIPQEDETAAVSTPMLVKEERPPLIISQHENPLYKPPPPLSTASSPRPRNAFTNQRQPPPYVPP